MKEEVKKLKQLIETSSRVLITSHISPDPDAVSSVLLLQSTLELNFKNKQVKAVLEEEPAGLKYLNAYEKINFSSLITAMSEFKPDLFFLLDGNSYDRASRKDGHTVRNYIQSNHVKTVIIDHHEPAGKDDAELFINRQSPSTVQDVYDLCFEELALSSPSGAAQTAITGFYADTGGFVYVKAGEPDKVFGFAQKMVEAGANIEQAKYDLESYTEDDIRVISELSGNISHGSNYSYSFLSDEFINKWQSGGHGQNQLHRGTNAFLNAYIRNIDKRSWGFIVYKNALDGNDVYSASFRSQAGRPDVSVIAGKLGGGGHKPAAGARFAAASLKDAIIRVQKVIAELAP